ncbi:hypothetical protein JSY36_10730 [Bacillus sp. H-16]|uniref:hypothetical protein n=1 Tax=Alteribacter salitolerans TaxID=2912333 RepID=UPI0019650604|nr:hypothetical protein [Alteribacter salitolerans]MBM7096232.1 hypothetical protein [Alteribacter salitolerans]
MSVTDLNAQKKWMKIPQDIRKKLLSNVFCSKCSETTIVDYDMKDDQYGILLEGKCKTCGKPVARLIED